MAKAEKIKIVKCRYSHCLHESKELNAEDAVKVGKSAYYHKDCCQTKENIAEIADIFVKRVDKNVAYPLLTKTINNIVFNKKVDSDFLLFALKYHLDHGRPLNYPQGMYYILSNEDMKKDYMIMQSKKIRKEQESMNTIVEENKLETSFAYKTKKKSGFESILRK